MSFIAVNPAQKEPQEVEWARLIPGDRPAFRKDNKERPLITPIEGRELSSVADSRSKSLGGTIGMLLPAPMHSRIAGQWLTALAFDWALMGLNWLLSGAVLVSLHAIVLRPVWIERAARQPLSLLGIAVLHAALVTLVGHTEGLYESWDLQRQGRVLAKSIVLATAVLCSAFTLQKEPWSRSAMCCVVGLMHFSALWTWRQQARRQDAKEKGERNVLIIGASTVGRRVAAYLEQHPESGRRLYGLLDDEKPIGAGVVGRVRDLARIARMGFVDELILVAPKNSELTLRVLQEARRLRLDLEIIPDLFGCKAVQSEVAEVGGWPAICLHAETLPALHLIVKRTVDVLGAGAMLTVLLPFLAAIALLIKLDSPGPVFYCAQRAGRKGKTFRCYKFRTMVVNADELKLRLRQSNERSGPFFKIGADPRITRAGAFLRRYSLDELPQLWNVLRGEMSLVGPRPHPLDDVAGYEIEHLARLDVTPGVTGLWQVTARRDPSFQRGMELDREYIRTWSLGLDLKILLRTFMAIVQGSGQ